MFLRILYHRGSKDFSLHLCVEDDFLKHWYTNGYRVSILAYDERPVPLRQMGRSSTMNEAILYDNRGVHFFGGYKTIQNIRRIHAFTFGPVH